MARWEEAVDYQLDLWKWCRSPAGIQYHTGWAKSVLNQRGEHELSVINSGMLQRLPEIVETAVFNADPIYVDPDMMTVAEAAFDSFHAESLEPTDLITPNGFMVFPRPISFPDVRFKQVSNRAILWHSYVFGDGRNLLTENEEKVPIPGIIFMMFSHADDRDDYWDSDMAEIMRKRYLGSNKLILNHIEPWAFGERHIVNDPRSIDKYAQTFWRLLNQTITIKSEAHPSRFHRKRAKKVEFPEKKVTVVTLRRPRNPSREGEPNSVEWTHRWLVAGHWRNQWFPSMSIHRQIWISPYVKGPENLPLEMKKMRVFELVR